jgi:hypothetical protein
MKRLSKILLILITINILLFNKASATISGNFDESGYKTLADFIYNIQKFVDSPEGIVCVYGNDDVAISITSRYSEVLTLRDNDLNNLKKCKLIYIAEDRERFLRSFMGEINSQKIASISFLNNFLDNDGTFYVQITRSGKMKLLLNPHIKSLGIKINPLILNLINNN